MGEAPGDDKRFEVIKMNDSKRHREFVELPGPPEFSREHVNSSSGPGFLGTKFVIVLQNFRAITSLSGAEVYP